MTLMADDRSVGRPTSTESADSGPALGARDALWAKAADADRNEHNTTINVRTAGSASTQTTRLS
jgi:hypothetical protein